MAQRWFAFLRAINTGNRRLTNEQLLEPFEALGFHDVAAYQAAGNVTFRTDASVDEAPIESALAATCGFAVPTFVRGADEVRAVADATPFTPGVVATTAGRVQVAFLRSEPSAEQVAAAADLTPDDDRTVVIGREWYWLPVDGISASKLPVGQVERVLGEMTLRTVGTVERMAARFA